MHEAGGDCGIGMAGDLRKTKIGTKYKKEIVCALTACHKLMDGDVIDMYLNPAHYKRLHERISYTA